MVQRCQDDIGKRSGTHSFVAVPQESKPSISLGSSPATPIQGDLFDQLEEALKNLDASGYRLIFEEGHQDLLCTLESILADRESYRRLLRYRDDQAQLIIDALQWVRRLSSNSPFPKLICLEFLCVHPFLEDLSKRSIMQALVRLSKCAKLLPRSFSLAGIKIGQTVVETSNVDVFRGLHEGRAVCLKKYRVLRQSQSNDGRVDMVEVCIIHLKASSR
jgi:hypothetical protein